MALIETGGALSEIGSGLQGLARTGTLKGGLEAALTAFGIDTAIGAVPGKLFPGLSDANQEAASTLIGEAIDAVRRAEAACGY